MNKYLLDIDVLLRIWARGPVVAEAIRHPNFTTTASYADLAARRLREGLRRELHLMSPVDGMRLRTGTDSELGRFEIQLSPPRNSIDWIQPIYLRINYVSWRTDDLLVTYVPAVDLEVLSEDETELHNRLEEEVRSTLERLGISKDLRQLWPLLRQRSLELETITVPIVFDSSSKTTDSRRKTKRAMKGLSKIATLWQDEFLSPCFFRDNELSQAEAILASDRPRSLLLVGPSGAGKTAVAHHLALHRADFKLAETTFWSTTGSRLMAGMCGFGMWQERCDKMVRNASTIGAVMHLGSLVELLEAGRWQGQPGVASYLRSAIDRGRLLAIAECTEEQFDRIDREEPQLRLAFETVRVTTPHCAVTHKIIRSASHSLAKKITKGARESLLTDDGLDELQRLHQRFGTYSVSPGRELRFLESVGRDHAKQGEHFDPLTPADIDAAFSRQTGLPLFLLDDSQPLDLSKTKNFFQSRLVGQDHVIRDVVDTLSMVKAQLTPSDKPIASMLFIGPTGVGKTEMAKSIAEFLFSDPNRLVRIDMSEMNTPLAIERLVGGPGRETGLLVRKIREQPFSVLLLDEFEKADPIVFDLLLQVLGEGRLTDVDGNRADFSNCIVIMTSNLGVDSFRPQPFGFGSDDPDQTESLAAEQPSDSEIRMSLDANDSSPKSDTDTHPDRSSNPVTTRYSEHFVRKTQEFLRPELFNRIDRIIAFSPLGPAETQQIARRHLELIRRREGLDLRGVTIEADEDVIAHLAATGFHPRYGARALHRAFEQQLLRPLASALSAYGVGVQVNANATMVSGKIAVAVKATQPSSKDAPNDRPPSEVVARATKLRRNGQALDKCGAILKHRNELEQARQTLSTTEKRLKRNDRQPLREYRSKLLHIVKTRQRTLESVTRIVTETQGIEERTLLAAYGKETWNQVEAEQEIDVIESKLRAMLMSLTTGGRSSDVRSTTVVFFENSKDAAYLLRAWKQLAIENDWRGSGYYIKPYNKKSDPDPSGKKNTPKDRRLDDSQKPSLHLFARKQSDKPDEPREKILDAFHVSAIDQLFEPPSGAIGWAVQWQGDRAHLLLGSESGQHTFRCDGEARRVLVEETTQMLVGYDAPPKINRATSDSMAMADARRFYDFESRTIDDIFLGTTVQWQKNRLEKSIVDSMNQGLENRLWKLLDEDYTSVNVWPDAEIVITN